MPYQEIFNHTYEFEGLLDRDGTLEYVNDPALRFGGVTREDVVGKKFWETDWVCWSGRVQQQVRAAIHRAANGEFIRQELEVRGEDRTAIIDFSLSPFTSESGDKTWLLTEGRDITHKKSTEGVSSLVPREPLEENLLVTYSRESDEAMTHSIVEAFLTLDIDVFARETTLKDWINADVLDELAWCSERPLTLITRLWAYTVVLSDGEVRIYADQ